MRNPVLDAVTAKQPVLFSLLVATALALPPPPVFGQGVPAPPGGNPGNAICPDSQLLSGKLMTDVCWDCLFPIRIMGVDYGGGNRPAEAVNDTVCTCKDSLGVPRPGIAMGMWEPARVIETTFQPYCMSALGGVVMDVGSARTWGTLGHPEHNGSDFGFFNYHYYSFPLLTMLDLFFDDRCKSDGFEDFDLMYMSELDPTWNDATLAFFANPESAALANPVAQAACIADAVSSTAGTPLDSLFWCAGTWGGIYPLSGFLNHQDDPVRGSSLASTRAVAALHRRGLAWKTMGSNAMCRGDIYPMIPKSQYKMAMFYPRPETKKGHVIGESVYTWGLYRNVQTVGEVFQYILYRWNDCCMTF